MPKSQSINSLASLLYLHLIPFHNLLLQFPILLIYPNSNFFFTISKVPVFPANDYG